MNRMSYTTQVHSMDSIVIYIVILVFVLIPSLTILFIVNISTVSLLQMDIAVLMQTLLQVQLMSISL